MAIVPHVSEHNVRAGAEGGIRLGASLGILVDGDLSSLAAAKAAVRADAAKLHVSEKNKLGEIVCKSLDQIDNFVAGVTAGTTVADAYDAAPGECRGRQLLY